MLHRQFWVLIWNLRPSYPNKAPIQEYGKFLSDQTAKLRRVLLPGMDSRFEDLQIELYKYCLQVLQPLQKEKVVNHNFMPFLQILVALPIYSSTTYTQN